MAHWDSQRIGRAKDRVLTTSDGEREYGKLLEKVRKDSLTMKPGQLANKYPHILIVNALKGQEVTNV
jgi:hypothetical protein